MGKKKKEALMEDSLDEFEVSEKEEQDIITYHDNALLLLIALCKTNQKSLEIDMETLDNLSDEDTIYIEYNKKKKKIVIRYQYSSERLN